MTRSTWEAIKRNLDRNLEILSSAERKLPTPSAKYCRESLHRTLGHLVACQSAWLPYLRQIQAGLTEGSIPINPDPLYRKKRFGIAAWEELLAQFKRDRQEWQIILNEVDVTKAIQTPKRTFTAQSLTKRLVDHETRHFQDHLLF